MTTIEVTTRAVTIETTAGPKGPQGDVGPQGPQGIQGIQGDPGPNLVSTSTATSISGLLKGNAANVLAATENTDYQGISIVVSSNTTAANNAHYTVVASATFTDPSPTEGRGYVVYVRNGTAIVGGTGYAAGALVYRFFHSGAWNSINVADRTRAISEVTGLQAALDSKQANLYPAAQRPEFQFIEDFCGEGFSPVLGTIAANGSTATITDIPYSGFRRLGLTGAANGYITIRAAGVAQAALAPNAIYRIKQRFKMPSMSGAEVLYALSGFASGISGAAPLFGGFFLLTSSSTGISVQCRTVEGGVAENTSVGTVVSNTYYTFEVVISLTSVKFYLNNVLVATHTTIIPTGNVGNLLTPRCTLYNNAVITGAGGEFLLDYFALHYSF